MRRRRLLARLLFLLTLLAPAGLGAAPPDEIDLLPIGRPPADRLEEIRRRVQSAVVYPAEARERGLEGTTRIQFQVGTDGRAHAVATVGSSGHHELDRAAEQGARDADALPPLYGRIRIPIRFQLDGR